MEFYRKKKQTPSVPILPLIDILTILLIFFVVTTEQKKEKSRLPLKLPDTSMPSITSTESYNVIYLSKNGQINIGATIVPSRAELVEYFKLFKDDNPKERLELMIDEDSPFKDVIFLQESLTKAGYKTTDVIGVRIKKKNDAAPSDQ